MYSRVGIVIAVVLVFPFLVSAATCSNAVVSCPAGQSAYYYPSKSVQCPSGGYACAKAVAAPKSGSVTSKPASVPTAASSILTVGSRGNTVSTIQLQLVSLKYLAADSATGYFGNLTRAAVRKFQCDKLAICGGSEASNGWGSVGPKTRSALVGEVSNHSSILQKAEMTIAPGSVTQASYAQGAYAGGGSSYSQGAYSGGGAAYSQGNYYSQSSYVSSVTAATPATASCTVASPATQTQTLSCPTGQVGSITQTRTSSCAVDATSPGWSAWVTTGSTCASPQQPIVFQTQGLMYKTTAPASGAHQYQVQWNPNNLYINNTGKPKVIRSMDVTFRAREGLGLAYADVCAVIMKDGDSGIVNGVESICFTEYKAASATEWDHPTVHVEFPGQGLWFPSGTYFVCGSQGISDATQNPPNYAADITCKATIVEADASDSKMPVQALRAPYIDQRFAGGVSAYTPHTNSTAVARPVLGVWTYLGTFATSIIQCLGTKAGSAGWGQQCTPFDASATPNPMPLTMQNPGYAFNPGDQVGAQCTIQSGSNSQGSICASYIYVGVPVINGSFAPLARNATIAAPDAQSFCNSDANQYAITDGSTPGACLATLTQ